MVEPSIILGLLVFLEGAYGEPVARDFIELRGDVQFLYELYFGVVTHGGVVYGRMRLPAYSK